MWLKYRIDFYFVLILALFVALMLFSIEEMSVHYIEALGVLNSSSWEYDIARFSIDISSKYLDEEMGLKIAFLCFSILNCILMYVFAKSYLNKNGDALVCVILFMLLPGIVFSSIMVLKSSVLIFLILSMVLAHQHRENKINLVLFYILLFIFSFIDFSFSAVLLGVFFYSLRIKNTNLAVVALILFGINMTIYAGDNLSGRPSGYILELISTISMLYSPLFFIYYFYTLYNSITKAKKQELVVYIALSSIFFTLILSLRQNVDFSAMIPASVVALPVAIKKFYSDMRLRLRQFRFSYTMRFALVVIFLVVQSGAIVFNKIFYLFDTQNHFADAYYISHDLSDELKKRGITNIKVNDEKLAAKMRFYGIGDKSTNTLVEISAKELEKGKKAEIYIQYLGKKIRGYNIVPSKNLK